LGTGDGFVYIYRIKTKITFKKLAEDLVTKARLNKTASLFINMLQADATANSLKKNLLYASASSVQRAHSLSNPGDVQYQNKAKSFLCLNDSHAKEFEDNQKKNVDLVNSYISILEFRLSNNIEMLRKKQCIEDKLIEENENVSENDCVYSQNNRFCSLPASYESSVAGTRKKSGGMYSKSQNAHVKANKSFSINVDDMSLLKNINQRSKHRRLTQFKTKNNKEDGYDGNNSSEEGNDTKIDSNRKENATVNNKIKFSVNKPHNNGSKIPHGKYLF
jgi:hypothetical protein